MWFAMSFLSRSFSEKSTSTVRNFFTLFILRKFGDPLGKFEKAVKIELFLLNITKILYFIFWVGNLVFTVMVIFIDMYF
jgi:hypothetical protein